LWFGSEPAEPEFGHERDRLEPIVRSGSHCVLMQALSSRSPWGWDRQTHLNPSEPRRMHEYPSGPELPRHIVRKCLVGSSWLKRHQATLKEWL